MGGGIAGNPAKLALLDDVIKNVREANSTTYRDALYEWYTDELEARLHNDSKVAFTITRRHEDDLAGRLLARDGLIEDGGKWKVLILPAIRENGDDPNDPRDIGDALFPEMHSLERLTDIKHKNARTFTSLYQQRPAPEEGGKIKKTWFEVVPKETLPRNAVLDLWIDGAYTKETTNDPTGTDIFYFDKRENILYWVFSYAEYLEMPELLDHVSDVSDLHGLNYRS